MEREGSTVYYEVHGRGPALLLCNGIGFSCWSWYRQIPDLSRRFQVVAYDNRGCGRSPWNGKAFTMGELADDGVAILDHLGIARAHVFGVSMGGFVAQEVVLRHPGRALSLALGCTHCGAPEAVFMEAAVAERMAALARLGWTAEGVRQSLDLNFSPAFIDQEGAFVEDYVGRRVSNASATAGWMAQREGSLLFRSAPRLGQIRVPTLVLHGAEDLVVPAVNASILAQAIPGAQARLWDGARHAFFLEQAPSVNETLATHMESSQ